MTGFQNLQREHPRATAIFQQEHAAWQAYSDYMVSKMYRDRVEVVQGDDESRRLFSVWRSIRNERDGISNPRHKQNRQHGGRFSTRGERR